MLNEIDNHLELKNFVELHNSVIKYHAEVLVCLPYQQFHSYCLKLEVNHQKYAPFAR